jgi:hypothetical protein
MPVNTAHLMLFIVTDVEEGGAYPLPIEARESRRKTRQSLNHRVWVKHNRTIRPAWISVVPTISGGKVGVEPGGGILVYITSDTYSMKALIVDDDLVLADVVSFTLRRSGFQVIAAHDGQTALDMWRAESPDLIILDLNLPKIDGFEVCQKIREQDEVPIIILSVRGDTWWGI